jgi:hypothetical protein
MPRRPLSALPHWLSLGVGIVGLHYLASAVHNTTTTVFARGHFFPVKDLHMQQVLPSEPLPFTAAKTVSDMSLVEIAEQLERVTSWIEAQRVREREARTAYNVVAQQVEANVQQIRQHAQQLLEAQHRKMASFSGMLSPQQQQALAKSAPAPMNGTGSHSSSRGKMNIADAIVAIWDLPQFRECLTTEEIAEALPETGYKSNAAPTSLKSSINQALAKLCRVGRVIRFRSDGTRIPPRDNKSRARKYIAAAYATDEE